MVILQGHVVGAALPKCKGDSPVAGDRHAISAFTLPSEFVETVAGQVHIGRFYRCLQTIQETADSCGVLCGNAPLALGQEKALKPFVGEGLYYCLSVMHDITHFKIV